eukprot:TRINITY_DN19740_c0_g4_i1.p1 TRINITY_DN19740_c0_g4~~TRINITY_DN19740_c0_g4_i1.p1  ORF type:complete len:386 (+),score=67.28 TRINITY_DN19740_c0_g4_i1:61-1218(+)
MLMRLSILLCACVIVSVDAHGAVVDPPPRNAVDKDLSPWDGPVPANPPSVESMTGWCPSPNKSGVVSGQNGQSCFWFSNGCAVGCDTCDGSSRGPIPSCGTDPTVPCPPQTPPTGTGRNKVGPGVACAKSNGIKPTICDPSLRTVNRAAKCGAEDDWYMYSPWRAPGAAPVFDSCGVAGGHRPPEGSFGGIYVNTTHAKLGDYGSRVLPKAPSGTSWKAGAVYEVSWTIEANHGGGYSYRLAPADGPLTEASFGKIPLDFVGSQKLRWHGGKAHGGLEIEFNGTYVSSGTVPAGSMWARNPIPRNDMQQTGQGFEPICVEFGMDAKMCSGMEDGSGGAEPSLEIVDQLVIPKDLPAGEYVLGWRWDCEESNQIWQSCSDVTITVA